LQADLSFDANSVPFIVFGTLLLFTSWLFFNGGSAGTLFNSRHSSVSKIIMVTIISGTSGGLCSCFVKPLIMATHSLTNVYDVAAMTNGILSGLVAITAIADRVEPWAAFIIGIVSAFVYSFSCKLLTALNIDDPIEASPVHGFNGIWGLIAVGIFDNQIGVVTGLPGCGTYFMYQVFGALVITVWSIVTAGVFFTLMSKLEMLRVNLLSEIIGLDIAEFGSKADFRSRVMRTIETH